MPHLHLPLQSGSDAVLRRMARRCKTADFKRLVEEARAQVPNLNVTTDIIVGFPGETTGEWQQTLAYVSAIGFGHLHIFSYSPRAGTKACDLPHQVSAEIKRQRSQELHRLGQRLKKETISRYLGREFSVLIEGSGEPAGIGQKLWRGYTPNFLRVVLRSPAELDLENRIRQVKLETLDESGEHAIARLMSNTG